MLTEIKAPLMCHIFPYISTVPLILMIPVYITHKGWHKIAQNLKENNKINIKVRHYKYLCYANNR